MHPLADGFLCCPPPSLPLPGCCYMWQRRKFHQDGHLAIGGGRGEWRKFHQDGHIANIAPIAWIVNAFLSCFLENLRSTIYNKKITRYFSKTGLFSILENIPLPLPPSPSSKTGLYNFGKASIAPASRESKISLRESIMGG